MISILQDLAHEHHGMATPPAGNLTLNASAELMTSLEDQKMGSLMTIVPVIIILAAAWATYYSNPKLFPTEGYAYLVLIASSFAATSISMNMLNKVCVAMTAAPSTLTTIQMAFTVAVTMAFSGREVLQADRRKAFRWMIVPVMYAGMLNSSLLGYKYLTLSLVTVFRNLAPLLTMCVEGLVMEPEHRPTVTLPMVASLLMMVAGAVVYSQGLVGATWVGLVMVVLNTVLALGDRLLQRRLLVSECKDLPLSACMTINNTFGMLPTFAMAFAMHEMDGYQAHSASWTDPKAMLLVGLSACMGMGIGFFGLMVQKVMTATSFQVLQNVSKAGVVAVGVGVFGDKLDSPARVIGMALSLFGSACYGYAKTMESMAASPSEAKGERMPLLEGRFAPFSAAQGLLERLKGCRRSNTEVPLAAC
jgi:multidrug transporter EmrE-like cation transporter